MQKTPTAIDILQKCMLIAGLAIAVSLLISPGLYVQRISFAILDRNSHSIYYSVYEDGIAWIPRLSDWLQTSFSPSYLAISFFVSLVALLRPSARWLISGTWIAAALGLSALDTAGALRIDPIAISSLPENYAANAIGALILAAVLAVILFMVASLVQPIRIPPIWKSAYISIGIIFVAAILSVILHFTSAHFLHALPFHARISAELPVSGSISTTKSPHSENVDKNAFDLLPRGIWFGQLGLVTFDDLAFQWNKRSEKSEFSIQAHPVSGCLSDSDFTAEPRKRAILTREGIQNVAVHTDADMKHVYIHGTHSDIEMLSSSVAIFSLSSGSDNTTVKVDQFIGEHSGIRASSSADLTILMSGMLVTSDDERQLGFADRYFSLIIDGEETKVHFNPPKTFSEDQAIECKTLADGWGGAGEWNASGEHVIGGIVVRILRTKVPTNHIELSDGEYTLTGASGWFTVPNMEVGRLAGSGSGNIGLIEIKDTAGELDRGSGIEKFSKDQRFHGFGDLTARYRKDGGLSVSGEYWAAWMDEKRLNPTKWESLSVEWKVAIIGFALTVLGVIARLTFNIWRKNEVNA